jgi:hypothetical protein
MSNIAYLSYLADIRYIYVNRAVSEFYSLENHEIVGRSGSELGLSQESLDGCALGFQQCVDTGLPSSREGCIYNN